MVSAKHLTKAPRGRYDLVFPLKGGIRPALERLVIASKFTQVVNFSVALVMKWKVANSEIPVPSVMLYHLH